MPLRSQSVGPIGIDIGARRVRVVQLRRRSGGCELVAAGRATLDPGAAHDGDTLRSLLAKVLAGRKFIGNYAVTCLASADVEVKNMRLPNMPEAELESAVAFEARERFRDLGDDLVIRSIPAGLVGRAGDEQQEVIVLAASSVAIEARLKLLTDQGLIVCGIEPAANAFFRPFGRFLKQSSDTQQAHAFVDLGARGSRILIARGSDIVFLKTSPVGGELFDDLVGRALSVEPGRAAAVREECLGAGRDPSARAETEAVMNALKPALDQLGKEIGLCLRYYAVTFRGARPETVICGGGEVAAPMLVEYLSQATQIPVRVGETWRGIDCGTVFDDADLGTGLPEWTTAVGLALKDRQEAGQGAKVA